MASIDARLGRLLAGMEIGHACEVGVFEPKYSKALELAGHAKCITLVEPHPEAARQLVEMARDRPHIRVIPKAVARSAGKIDLVEAESSTFVRGVVSPAASNSRTDAPAPTIHRVDAVPFGEIDSGDLDVLLVDTEGSEWDVLQGMMSTPKVLVIELYGRRYRNPHLAEIKTWAATRGYRPWGMDKSDVVFVHESFLAPSAKERAQYQLRLLRVTLRHWRYAVLDALR